MHSGTGRITKLKMYPMSLYESKESNGCISLSELFENPNYDIDGKRSDLTIEQLVFAACRGGWPASLNAKSEKGALFIAKTYLQTRTIQRDILPLQKLSHLFCSWVKTRG